MSHRGSNTVMVTSLVELVSFVGEPKSFSGNTLLEMKPGSLGPANSM